MQLPLRSRGISGAATVVAAAATLLLGAVGAGATETPGDDADRRIDRFESLSRLLCK